VVRFRFRFRRKARVRARVGGWGVQLRLGLVGARVIHFCNTTNALLYLIKYNVSFHTNQLSLLVRFHTISNFNYTGQSMIIIRKESQEGQTDPRHLGSGVGFRVTINLAGLRCRVQGVLSCLLSCRVVSSRGFRARVKVAIES
jgi:hypothetical protein